MLEKTSRAVVARDQGGELGEPAGLAGGCRGLIVPVCAHVYVCKRLKQPHDQQWLTILGS